jgi:hypothetical protein
MTHPILDWIDVMWLSITVSPLPSLLSVTVIFSNGHPAGSHYSARPLPTNLLHFVLKALLCIPYHQTMGETDGIMWSLPSCIIIKPDGITIPPVHIITDTSLSHSLYISCLYLFCPRRGSQRSCRMKTSVSIHTPHYHCPIIYWFGWFCDRCDPEDKITLLYNGLHESC